MRQTPPDRFFEVTTKEKLLVRSDERKKRKNWLGTMAVWLSGISALVYFFTSYGIKNHILFLVENFKEFLGLFL